MPLASILHLWSLMRSAASVTFLTPSWLHRRSATALPLGQVLLSRLVASAYSPHMLSSPPITSAFCAGVPVKFRGSCR